MSIILLLLLITVSYLWKNERKKLKNAIFNAQQLCTSEKNELKSRIHDLELLNNELSKYQGIIDAKKEAQNILSDAENSAAMLTRSAQAELENAQNVVNEIKANAREEVKQMKQKAEEKLNDANQKTEKQLGEAIKEAGRIIENANKRAEEIAGEAYSAMKNAQNLERTVQAMKNIITGYGNSYLIPGYSLLDELAAEFGHTEAGEELKKARERTRLMLKNETAAKCDYVEYNRRVTAINFVTDAFNGKVDTILANVKSDNYGTLSQKIKDAYSTVNYNGTAFRNATITDEYLQSRLDELKWATIVQELKIKEKEEQRIIKEQIREEEKARREFERAIKEAEKEEEMLKKAMEKIRKEVEGANEAQKAKYEKQLEDLALRLKEAEDKNQRALSMAQQTKSGHVYIISNIGSFGEDVYKIGMTRRLEPLDRVKELGDASVPFEFDVHAMIYSEDAPSLEKELHKKFVFMQVNKVNPRKEFFRISLKEIKDEVSKKNVDIKWTMTAAAREFRESLNIEQALKDNKINKEEWSKQQTQIIATELIEEEEA